MLKIITLQKVCLFGLDLLIIPTCKGFLLVVLFIMIIMAMVSLPSWQWKTLSCCADIYFFFWGTFPYWRHVTCWFPCQRFGQLRDERHWLSCPDKFHGFAWYCRMSPSGCPDLHLHMAISGLLQYKLIMNKELCTKLEARSWVIIIPVQARQMCFLCLSVDLMKLIIIKHCSSITKKCVINTILVTNPKHSTAGSIMKKINSTPDRAITFIILIAAVTSRIIRVVWKTLSSTRKI